MHVYAYIHCAHSHFFAQKLVCIHLKAMLQHFHLATSSHDEDASGLHPSPPEDPNIVSILDVHMSDDDDEDGDLAQSTTDAQLLNMDWMAKYGVLKQKYQKLKQQHTSALQKAHWWQEKCMECA